MRFGNASPKTSSGVAETKPPSSAANRVTSFLVSPSKRETSLKLENVVKANALLYQPKLAQVLCGSASWREKNKNRRCVTKRQLGLYQMDRSCNKYLTAPQIAFPGGQNFDLDRNKKKVIIDTMTGQSRKNFQNAAMYLYIRRRYYNL